MRHTQDTDSILTQSRSLSRFGNPFTQQSPRLIGSSERYDGTTDTDAQLTDANKAWCKWFRQLIHDDYFGLWFAFSLTPTKQSFTNTINNIRHRINRTNETNGVFAGTGKQVIKRHGTMAFLLPAVSQGKHIHLHGAIRLPRLHCDKWVSTRIKDNNQHKEIAAPFDVRGLVFPTRYGTKIDKTFADLHICHDNGRMVDLRTEWQIADHRVFNYWINRDEPIAVSEWRVFEEAEMYPHYIRLALPCSNTDLACYINTNVERQTHS